MRLLHRSFWHDLIQSVVFTWVTIPMVLCLFVCPALLTGRLRVHGYIRALKTLRGGRVIIAPNHPSWHETMILPAVFYPLCLLFPRLGVWSLARKSLFSAPVHWCLHCVPVDVENAKRGAHARLRLAELLKAGCNVCIYPEGGRTHSQEGADLISKGDRHMRRVTSWVPHLAQASGARILPVWIDHACERVCVRFGHAYSLETPFKREEEKERLEQKILEV